jgi:hypothetical protein
MRVIRIEDKVRLYNEDGQLIFYGDYTTLMRWVNPKRHKIGSDKKIHGLE